MGWDGNWWDGKCNGMGELIPWRGGDRTGTHELRYTEVLPSLPSHLQHIHINTWENVTTGCTQAELRHSCVPFFSVALRTYDGTVQVCVRAYHGAAVA